MAIEKTAVCDCCGAREKLDEGDKIPTGWSQLILHVTNNTQPASALVCGDCVESRPSASRMLGAKPMDAEQLIKMITSALAGARRAREAEAQRRKEVEERAAAEKKAARTKKKAPVVALAPEGKP